MTTTQKNKWARNNAVSSLLKNAPEAAPIPGFAGAMALYEAAMDKLRGTAAQQSEPLSTSVIERELVLHEMQQLTLTAAGQAHHYASEKKLPALANKVRVRPGTFRALRPEQRVQLAQMVHDAIVPLAAQLGDYGITVASLQQFQTAIEAGARAVSAPRDATVKRRGATVELRDAFRAVDAVIANSLTPLLLPLRDTNPGFFARYKAALKVVDRPGTRGSVEAAPIAVPQTAPAAAATPLAA